MGKPINLTGRKFGKLTVLYKIHNTNNHVFWLCVCDCGNLTEVRTDALRKGDTKSCGCLTCKHGKCTTKLYKVWLSMKQRCTNPKNKAYKNYGGRGIAVCSEWLHDFTNFYNWAMNNGYKEGLSIDRVDNNGNYSPNNCRWANRKTQQRNRRDCIYYIINGEKHCLKEWCNILNLKYSTVKARLHYGWDIERALELGGTV